MVTCVLTGRETGANDSSCAPQRIPAPHIGPKREICGVAGVFASRGCVDDLFRVAYSRVCHTTADNICFLFRISAAHTYTHSIGASLAYIPYLTEL